MRLFRITQVDPERSRCPYKRQDRKDTRRKGHVPTEAEAGELQPQAQGRLEPPEAGRAGRPRPGALGHLDFRLCPADSERRHLSSLAAPTGGLGPGHPATRVTRCLLSTEQLVYDTSVSEMPPALLADGETEAWR